VHIATKESQLLTMNCASSATRRMGENSQEMPPKTARGQDQTIQIAACRNCAASVPRLASWGGMKNGKKVVDIFGKSDR
jgi:hypothetical protein